LGELQLACVNGYYMIIPFGYPLIVFDPRLKETKRSDCLGIEHFDVPSTILDLAGIPQTLKLAGEKV